MGWSGSADIVDTSRRNCAPRAAAGSGALTRAGAAAGAHGSARSARGAARSPYSFNTPGSARAGPHLVDDGAAVAGVGGHHLDSNIAPAPLPVEHLGRGRAWRAVSGYDIP